jgi:DNA-binding NarL/FixJ family response regulator
MSEGARVSVSEPMGTLAIAEGFAARRPRGELGPRQRDVAQLAVRGLTNKEIGELLGISINTVKARLKEVFHRLEVTNRTELAFVLGTED